MSRILSFLLLFSYSSILASASSIEEQKQAVAELCDDHFTEARTGNTTMAKEMENALLLLVEGKQPRNLHTAKDWLLHHGINPETCPVKVKEVMICWNQRIARHYSQGGSFIEKRKTRGFAIKED